MKKYLLLTISIILFFACEDKQEKDCAGVEGGTAVLDNCDNCVGGDTGETACVEDCNGDFGGTSNLDNCDVCDSDITNDCVQDCNEEWGGTATVDNCDNCVGGNTGVEVCTEDCNGDWGGTATVDNCDNCVGGDTGEIACTEDCNGDWGGTSWESDCGCVSVDNSGDDCDDCAGIPNGNSEILIYWYDADSDGLGAGESSAFCSETVEAGWVLNNDDTDDNCTSNVHDCTGICDGDAVIDCEDICNGGAIEDCAGVCHGTTQPDDCTVTDIDGNVYQNVQIGDQLWMAENLRVTHYKNGNVISTGYSNSEWDSLNTGAYAVYDDHSSNVETYGYLYNWYAVDDERGVCPEDWHVPTDYEYKLLEMYLGMSQEEADDSQFRGTNEGSKLAGREDLWMNDPNHNGNLDEDPEFGIAGFTGLPGGFRSSSTGNYDGINWRGFYWSSTGYGNGAAKSRGLNSLETGVLRGDNMKGTGISVRCLKD